MTVWKLFTNLCLMRLFIVDFLGNVVIDHHNIAFMELGGGESCLMELGEEENPPRKN